MEPFIDSSFDGPQLDDIRGLHWMYGDALEKSNGGFGNNSATLATDLGTLITNGTLAIGTGAAGATQAVATAATDFVSITDSFDFDYYSFSILSPMALDIALTPRGGVFTQGTEEGLQATFNANARNNLSLILFDRNGATQLSSINNVGPGQTESLAGFNLPTAGEYFVRVAGTNDSIQLYQLELSSSSAVQLLAGDYNLDGKVDSSDYVVWRNTLGQLGPALAADGNGNGIVDGGDYALWRSNFGSFGPGSLATNRAVPELTSLKSFLIAALINLVMFRMQIER
jgi:hypothetical protein